MMLPLRAQIFVVPSGDWTAETLRAMVQELAGVNGSLVNAISGAVHIFFWIRRVVAWNRILLIVPFPFWDLGAKS